MQHYVNQLIEDLKVASAKQHTRPYIEQKAEFEATTDLLELDATPYKTIEKWTGIKQISFPHSFRLSDEQIDLLLPAIFDLLESFNIDLVDKPDDIPSEVLYDVLVESWDEHVQYLPSTGFDLEICTGDPDTCPYIGFCDCGEEFSEDDDEAPPYIPEDNEDYPGLPF